MNQDIPLVPREFFEDDTTPEREVLRGTKTFFIDHFEYPESGGIYIYKFGGILKRGVGEPRRHFGKSIEELTTIANEEAKKGYVPESNNVFFCDHCNYAGVTFLPQDIIENRVDFLHPVEGFPDPTIMPAINEAKRILSGYIKFFSSKEAIFSMGLFVFLPFKRKLKLLENYLQQYFDTVRPILHPYFLKEKLYTDFTKELRKLTAQFLIHLGIGEPISTAFSLVFSLFFEYDDVYRTLSMDILSETTKEQLMENPRKELKRLVDIFVSRSPNEKLQRLSKNIELLSLVFLYPKVKKAFKNAINSVELSKMQMNEAQRYHTLKMEGYDFGGRTIEDRGAEYMKVHNNNPPLPISLNIA